MIYFISKALWIVTAPTNALILITVAAAFWTLIRKSKSAARLAVLSACGLAIGGFAPVGLWAMAPLENRFPEWESGLQAAPCGIILLGGDTGDGLVVLAELSQQFPEARLVYSGPGRSIAIAAGLLEKFANFGGDPTRIAIETQSRTTFDNAIYSAELMKPRPDERWLLVTSALHMPRSIGSFRRAGFGVEPYSIHFNTRDNANSFFENQAGSKALSQFDAAAREWIGLVVYRIMGRTDALFPGP
jgi:uncharacterized SAM-binding protein YcdF (DUF218 family)